MTILKRESSVVEEHGQTKMASEHRRDAADYEKHADDIDRLRKTKREDCRICGDRVTDLDEHLKRHESPVTDPDLDARGGTWRN